jgi:hypothetical protein
MRESRLKRSRATRPGTTRLAGGRDSVAGAGYAVQPSGEQ